MREMVFNIKNIPLVWKLENFKDFDLKVNYFTQNNSIFYETKRTS